MMITAVILTHNDEEIIENTLSHLAWCDEILLVDDYSTDRTVEKSKKLVTRILYRHLDEDFAAQRNFALKEAKGDWVLFIDSDETVSQELQKEIKKVVDNIDIAGYYLKRTDVMFGRELRYGETGNIRLLRLAKRDAGLWERPVHEVWNIQGSARDLTSPLYHYPHPKVAQFLDEVNTYSSVNARYLYSKKVRTTWMAIVMYPAAKFFVNYLWRMGFLDGTAGAIVAIMMSFHSFLTRAKLYHLWQTSKTA